MGQCVLTERRAVVAAGPGGLPPAEARRALRRRHDRPGAACDTLKRACGGPARRGKPSHSLITDNSDQTRLCGGSAL